MRTLLPYVVIAVVLTATIPPGWADVADKVAASAIDIDENGYVLYCPCMGKISHNIRFCSQS